MKKVFLFLTLFSLLTSTFSVFAAQESKPMTLVVFGDASAVSIKEENGGEESTENAQEIKNTVFSDIVAEKYELTESENYFNFAEDGETAQKLLEKLSGDFATENRDKLSDADAVIISLVCDEFKDLLVKEISTVLNLDEDAGIKEISESLSRFDGEDLKELEKSIESLYTSKKDEITEKIETFGKNLDKIIEKLKKISPDAQIYVVGAYDPLNDFPQYKSTVSLDEKFVSKAVALLRSEILAVADENEVFCVDTYSEFSGRKIACVDAENDSILPSENGNKIIADALVSAIESQNDGSSNGEKKFEEGKYIGLYFAAALTVVAILVPVVCFVAKKASGK